jgi:hypothetical protein
MPLRRVGLSNYQFIWRRQLQPGDKPSFLAQFKSDPSAMHDLRSILAHKYPGIPLSKLSDDQVIDAISRLVAAGELLIAREEPRHGGSAKQPDIPPDPPPGPSPSPSGPVGPPPEPPSLPPNLDPAALLAALLAAALAGLGVLPP